jgi:hypothetical protein
VAHSIAAGEVAVLYVRLQAVQGSGTTIRLCLSGEALSVGILITDPLATQPDDRGDSEGATAASGSVDGAGPLKGTVSLADLTFGLTGVRAKHGVKCVVRVL